MAELETEVAPQPQPEVVAPPTQEVPSPEPQPRPEAPKPEPTIPYGRFREAARKRAEAEHRADDLQRQLDEARRAPARPAATERTGDFLEDPEGRMRETAEEVATRISKEHTAAERSDRYQREIGDFLSEQPEWSANPQEFEDDLAAVSQQMREDPGIHMAAAVAFYRSTVGGSTETAAPTKEVVKVAQDGATRIKKEAVQRVGSGGSANHGVITTSQIEAMSSEEKRKRMPEIMAAYRARKIVRDSVAPTTQSLLKQG